MTQRRPVLPILPTITEVIERTCAYARYFFGPHSHAKMFTGSEKGRGHSNGNDTEKLARKAQGAAYLWATDRRCGCSDDGLVELHHHTIRHPHDLDHTQRGGLDRPLGSIPVYPAELGLIISGRLRSSLHND